MSSAPQPQKPGTFGQRLRREREMRGIKLEEISESTKIGKRNLVALEEEHFDQLPGGIFNKGFVRAYAKYLGLDEEQAVNDFLAASANYEQPASLQPPGMAARASRRERDAPAEPSSISMIKAPAMPSEATTRRRQRLWALSAALILVLGLWFWLRPHGLKERLRSAGGAQRSGTAAAHDTTRLQPEAAVPLPAGPLSQTEVAPAAQNAQRNAAIAASSASAPTSSPGATLDKSTSNPAAFNPAPIPGISLELRATAEVWVSTSADGAPALNLTLQPGEMRSLRAQKQLVLKTGNAGALEVTFNGKPLPPLGKEKEVKTLTFTPASPE